MMDNFEIGSCFKSYEELMEKLKEHCNSTHTKFTTKDCRLIKDEFGENTDAKERLMYTDLKLICVHGRTIKVHKKEIKRKRTEKNVKTGCPAYFRLKLIHSGVALQIVALNVKHNHPLEAKSEDNEPILKQKKPRLAKEKAIKNVKSEIKSEDETSNEDDNFIASEYTEIYPDPEDSKCNSEVKFTFKGVCAPVFTPFHQDMTINVNVIQVYAKYLAENNITGVLINSNVTGESPSMSILEQKLLMDHWTKVVKSTKQHLMVQIGCCPLQDTLELAKHAQEVGVNSILCLPNLICKPKTPDELTDYLKRIGEAAPNIPLLYEHSPESTGVSITMEDFLKESTDKIPTFCGIRYCSVNLETGIQLLLDNEKYTFFWGTDTLLASAFLMGFQSAIVTMSNICPKEVVEIVNVIRESNLDQARSLQLKIIKLFRTITKYGSLVSSTKAAMNMLSSVKVGTVRYPLKNLSSQELDVIKTEANLLYSK